MCFHYFITSNQTQFILGQKLEVLVIHDPSRPVPPPPPSKTLLVGKTYKVGDSKGWKVYDSDFYNKLSEEKQFHVGDTLLFEYAKEVNDVYEINGHLEFMTCGPTSPVAMHKTGHDLVRLTEPGVHYLITSRSGYGASQQLVTEFPKKVALSAMERLNNWLQNFKPNPIINPCGFLFSLRFLTSLELLLSHLNSLVLCFESTFTLPSL
ncbi:hypothetical protein N665_0116s0115 [Sinapis alba]|nr:hypothetical protein N665_0116s0115 [Sinapis alba]